MGEDEIKKHLYILIICGGGGTRLWPRSRKKTPKQFLEKLYKEESIFSLTVKRAQLFTSNEKIFVITNNDYIDDVVTQGKIIPSRNVITEPQAKNTAMAMAVGATYIRKIDPKAIVVNFAADHIIEKKEIFVKELMLGAKTAASGNFIVAMGVTPTYPHTGLGYIEAGEKLATEDVYRVVSFKEKPDLATATQFLKSGNFYWNANLYIWSVDTVWDAFVRLAPSTYTWLEKIFNSIGQADETEILNQAYQAVENISIDYAISEKSDNLLLVPSSFLWNDIGDWKIVYDLKEKDNLGNSIDCFGQTGQTINIDSKNCLVATHNRLVAVVGVENIVVIETEDALLVCNKDRSQDVKKVVEKLKEEGRQQYL